MSIQKAALLVFAGVLTALAFFMVWLPRERTPRGVEVSIGASSEKAKALVADRTPEIFSPSLEEQWARLTATEFCLLGFQDYDAPLDDDFATVGEHQAANPYRLLPAIKKDKKQAVEFLIAQIPDKRESGVHICPFSNATHGELAVYLLQHILKKNWFELSENYRKQYEKANAKDGSGRQAALWKIISSGKGAQEMMSLWRAYLVAT